MSITKSHESEQDLIPVTECRIRQVWSRKSHPSNQRLRTSPSIQCFIHCNASTFSLLSRLRSVVNVLFAWEKTLSIPVDIVGTDYLSAVVLGHEPLLFKTSVPSEAVTAASTSPYASSTAAPP